MKKNLGLTIIFILFLLLRGISQSSLPIIDSKEYEDMKQKGTLPQGVRFPSPPEIIPSAQSQLQIETNGTSNLKGPNRAPASFCSCLVPIDATFSVVTFSG